MLAGYNFDRLTLYSFNEFYKIQNLIYWCSKYFLSVEAQQCRYGGSLHQLQHDGQPDAGDVRGPSDWGGGRREDRIPRRQDSALSSRLSRGVSERSLTENYSREKYSWTLFCIRSAPLTSQQQSQTDRAKKAVENLYQNIQEKFENIALNLRRSLQSPRYRELIFYVLMSNTIISKQLFIILHS